MNEMRSMGEKQNCFIIIYTFHFLARLGVCVCVCGASLEFYIVTARVVAKKFTVAYIFSSRYVCVCVCDVYFSTACSVLLAAHLVALSLGTKKMHHFLLSLSLIYWFLMVKLTKQRKTSFNFLVKYIVVGNSWLLVEKFTKCWYNIIIIQLV